MSARGLIMVMAIALTLQGCGGDSNHRVPQANEAVYPAGVESLQASYYSVADDSELTTTKLEIGYADDGKIVDQMITNSIAGKVFYTQTSLYNGNGDVEQETVRDDSDHDLELDLTCSTYYSYNAADDLIERYHLHTPDDPAEADTAFTTTYAYDADGNEVYKSVQKTEDNVPVPEDSYTVKTTYNDAGQPVTILTEEDSDGDGNTDKSQTKNYQYNAQGLLSSSHSVTTGLEPSEKTTEFTYNDNGLIEQVVTSRDDNGDGQRDSQQLSVYRYLHSAFPLDSVHTLIEYDAEDAISAQTSTVVEYIYDSAQRLVTFQRQVVDQLDSDLLLHAESWEFSYSTDGSGVSVESLIDANGDGESNIRVAGALTMQSADMLTHLYHYPIEGEVYHPVPLPIAIALGYIFED